MRAQVHCSSGEDGKGLLKTSFAYCIILPIILSVITLEISSPEVKKPSAVYHSGEFIVPRHFCKM